MPTLENKALEQLFDRIDVGSRDVPIANALAHWRQIRGRHIFPSLVELELNALGDPGAQVFAFERSATRAREWQLVFAGAKAREWLNAPERAALTELGEKRLAVRIRHLLQLALETGEPVVAEYWQSSQTGTEHVELLIAPLASDHIKPDAVFGAMDRTTIRRSHEQRGTATVSALTSKNAALTAADVMTPDVITVGPGTPVVEIVRLLLDHNISAVPVVDDGILTGVVSEADLVVHTGEHQDAGSPWWLLLLKSDADLAARYVKSHGVKAQDVMTAPVVTARRETPLHELVASMAHNHVRRVVVTDDERPVGIVTRADILKAHASLRSTWIEGDVMLRDALLQTLRKQMWYHLADRDVSVVDGVAIIHGVVESEAERNALRVAAEGVQGIRGVELNVEVDAGII